MDIRTLIDDLLEISVVGSFTRLGPVVRGRLFDWSPPPAGAMADASGPASTRSACR